jgi:hypothetical protein
MTQMDSVFKSDVFNNNTSSRAFHAYCIGTPKSGTHSIAGLFQPRYNSVHEPEHYPLIQLLLANQPVNQINKQLTKRDQHLGLELESSNLLSFFVESLVSEFTEAKFILTIRDCYSWLDSCLNHQLNAQRTEEMAFWWRYRDLCFRPEQCKHAAQEKTLAEHHLYTLDGYLSYWQRINQKILSTIPPERLLIVRTLEIEASIDKIAQFLPIPVETLNPSRSHLYRASKKFNLLWQIDRDFLEQKVEFYCRPLMTQYFPEVRDMNDATILPKLYTA